MHEQDRVLEKKMSSFEKMSNRFLILRKYFQNFTFFLLEGDLFREIDQIFGPKAHSRTIRPPTQSKGFVHIALRLGLEIF